MTDTPANHDPGTCEKVSTVFSRIGERWSMTVVMLLHQGPRRFSELKRGAEGISQRMLTLTLRNLERDGLVKRTVYAEVPPRVEYQLTELGRSLFARVRALGHWTEDHLHEIEAARSDFDQRGAGGQESEAPATPYASRIHRIQ
ncbi:winged helix-turn-helix transcriptional regulator [Bordetella bronchialis]|uniref:winged helix-turn-helix transcriptional regulator n=1 Tax=Bordetella bronchialis TaxID=463025 RepID=UPI000AFAD339